MELSALAGVAYYRECELSSILLITDTLIRPHTWNGIRSVQFHQGAEKAAQIAAAIFSGQDNAVQSEA
jgi:hypothetical protein